MTVILQNNLQWDRQINKQCSKIYAGLGHLKIIASMLRVNVKLKKFKSLLLPQFTYGSELIIDAPVRVLTRLRVALNCCVRWGFQS